MDIYLIIVIVLIILAVSDLIVGVSNDAVNFLNSAIGSRVASIRVIMIIASLGVLAGAVFSSGLMEVARKGIFHPEQFAFSEIMIIFLAVMVTDIFLLDLFNTFGLPTSTTVSIVFELLGAAVAISVIKISMSSTETLLDLNKYINSDKALAIITGILLSVVVAFTVGALVQYLSRLLFSFRFQKSLKYFGAVWGGLAITAITYFMLIKGIKGASLPETFQAFIHENTWGIIIYGFFGWMILLQLLTWLFKVSIPKVIVLVGTFALAMAFAGNDLVNFIGVPLAGLASYKEFTSTPGAVPDLFMMDALKGKVGTPVSLLMLAGVVMILTLWLSKKAKSVVATTLDLSRQGSGDERFGTSLMSRSIVRGAIAVNKSVSSVFPASLIHKIDQRFEIPKMERKAIKHDVAPSFDVIRASVNLVVASILIAFGTSLKLPLSTTYVTFMVAMGTSLADRAWGRDSAVYRIQGVFSVIGGWFLTALIAFIVSLVVANIIYWGGIIAIFVVLASAAFFIYRTHILHKKRESEKVEDEKEMGIISEITSSSAVFEKCQHQTIKGLSRVPGFYERLIEGLSNEDRMLLKELKKEVRKFNKKAKKNKDRIDQTVKSLQIDQINTGHYYIQSTDYLREIAHSLNFIVTPASDHIENNHTGTNNLQTNELKELFVGISKMYNEMITKIESKDFDSLEDILQQQQHLLKLINEFRINQVKRIREDDPHSRTSLLFLDILAETKNLILYSINLLKSQRDFIIEITI